MTFRDAEIKLVRLVLFEEDTMSTLTPPWKLQDAKAKFSQLVDKARTIGPQYVTRHGKNAVVVLSVEDYENMVANKPDFKDFLLSVPKISEDESHYFERQKDYPRDIEL